MTKEVCQEPHPEETKSQQYQAGQNRKDHGRFDILRSSRCRDLASRSRRHQGQDCNRAHRERPAGSEDRVDDQRKDGCIEANLWRQTGQHRIGERLRDQHDRHDQGCQQVIRQCFSLVGPSPVKDRQVSRQAKGHR